MIHSENLPSDSNLQEIQMKIKILPILFLAASAQLGQSQSLLFTHNTGVDFNEGLGQVCHPFNLGASYIGIALISADGANNDSRFYVFDLRGRLQLTLLGRDLGWQIPNVIPSPTGSFLIGGLNGPGEYADDKLYVFSKRTKTWAANTTLGKEVVWSDATAGNALASGIWAEMKSVGGKLVISVYRF